ncbi:MAG: hypothetical protein GXY36_17320 [Chloroflexi bacterium]|nr:hypothetical protein [Chloroflexota bacterium]
METGRVKIGRVIRVGRGWVDVAVNRKVRRFYTRPELLVRAGAYLQIVDDQVVALQFSPQPATGLPTAQAGTTSSRSGS